MVSDPSNELRPGTQKLSRDHDLTRFDCGKSALNDWLVRYAWQNQQADAAKTYVACRANQVAGAAGSPPKAAVPAGSLGGRDGPEHEIAAR